jgi:hypothetical protein
VLKPVCSGKFHLLIGRQWHFDLPNGNGLQDGNDGYRFNDYEMQFKIKRANVNTKNHHQVAFVDIISGFSQQVANQSEGEMGSRAGVIGYKIK